MGIFSKNGSLLVFGIILVTLYCETHCLKLGNLHFTVPKEYFLDVTDNYCGKTYSPGSTAVVHSHLSSTYLDHPNLHFWVEDLPTGLDCNVTLDSGSGYQWLVQFPSGVDTAAEGDCATGALYLNDGDTSGDQTLLSLCGKKSQTEMTPQETSGQFLTIQLTTGADTSGHIGFNLLVSRFRNTDNLGNCSADEFPCDTDQKCVSETYKCDGFKQCIDGKDEPQDLCIFDTDLMLTWDSENSYEDDFQYTDFGKNAARFFSDLGVGGTAGMIVGAVLVVVCLTLAVVWGIARRTILHRRNQPLPTSSL